MHGNIVDELSVPEPRAGGGVVGHPSVTSEPLSAMWSARLSLSDSPASGSLSGLEEQCDGHDDHHHCCAEQQRPTFRLWPPSAARPAAFGVLIESWSLQAKSTGRNRTVAVAATRPTHHVTPSPRLTPTGRE